MVRKNVFEFRKFKFIPNAKREVRRIKIGGEIFVSVNTIARVEIKKV